MLAIIGSSFGCGRPHTSIVGKWVHLFGSNRSSGMVYEFYSDGTMTHYSQVDLRSQLPQAGVMSSPKFNGRYTFKQGALTCHPTSVGDQDHAEALPNVTALDKTYKAVLSGDTLTLSQVLPLKNGPEEEYQRQ
jgi:hypothetical protein